MICSVIYYGIIAFMMNYNLNRIACILSVRATKYFKVKRCKAKIKEKNFSNYDINELHLLSLKNHKEDQLKLRLNNWIAEKEYCRKDVPIEETLAYLQTNISFFRRFLKCKKGMDFRTWRNRLRIAEACRIYCDHPEYTVRQICDLIGFNNTNSFHVAFQELTGYTSKSFRELPMDERVRVWERIRI